MAELKLCPFCGRIPMVEDCGDNRYFVRCKCGIAQDKLYGQRCDAVRRWNTRKPSVQPESKWIPCSERLPEALEEVLVTSKHGYVYTSRIVHGEFEYGGEVIAWMPLPKPYERSEDA